ncbi:MAG TPA: DUF3619 family protein [Usitatibacteraceae bacterium]|nr:DUF3619 family protein [Usitatibacteraceae bacterium]
MNENDFGRLIADRLNAGLSGLDDSKLNRLQKARQAAMAAIPQPVAVSGLATAQGPVLDWTHWVRKPLFWLPILAIAGVVAYTSWSSGPIEPFDEIGALDAKLLAGELPVDALLDKDFADWVRESGE